MSGRRELASVLLLAAAWLPARGAAAQAGVEEQHSAWRYERSVGLPETPPGAAPGFAALAVPPEVGARSRSDLADLRLSGADGRDVQYVIDRSVEREVVPLYAGRLADVRREKGRRSEWIVDLGEPRRFDRILLDVPRQDFAKRLRVEASDDGASWRTLREDAGIFDQPWSVRVHHTAVDLPEAARARYLRLTADDRKSKPIEVAGAAVSSARRIPGEEWRRPVGLTPLRADPGLSRYGLDLPSGFPLEAFELDADEPAFARTVALREERGDGHDQALLGEATLYRLRTPDEALSGESLLMALARPPRGGRLVLEVHDGDSPPLRGIRGFARSRATRLLFPAGPGPLALFYGNDVTRAPVYDLERLKSRLALSPAFVPASLGPERENPAFRKPLPLPLAPPRGAPVEPWRWRKVRRFAVAGREDLYTLTLAAPDLAALRGDLGDLRVVDEDGRQVPYSLEAGASEARLDLSLAPDTREGRGDEKVSRYRLTASGSDSGRPLELPLTALELGVREAFFARPARVLVAAGSPRASERVVFSGTLARDGAGGATSERPVVLGLDGSRVGALVLEIEEGDNAPLTLTSGRGLVRVPRIAFQAAPGAYRLLLGNPEAPAPRYDIAGLRQQILAYSAVPLQAEAAVPNPAFRRGAGDYLREAPPTLVLWGALLAAVVGLLLLTARIVGREGA